MLQWDGFNRLDLKMNEDKKWRGNKKNERLLMVHNVFENDHYFLNKHKMDESQNKYQ